MDILTKQMYVPDPKHWINYYKNVWNGNVNPYLTPNGKQQHGGGLMRSSKQFMIPIESDTHTTTKSTDVPPVQLVSPVEQVVNQAKEEIREGIKRKNNAQNIIPIKKFRRSNTPKKRKSKEIKSSRKKKSKKNQKLKKTGQRKLKGKNKSKGRKSKSTNRKPKEKKFKIKDSFS